MFSKGCPRADELEALATNGKANAKLKRHVERCPTCTQIVEALRRDAELLAKLREAIREGLDEETREHVLELAAEAARPKAETPKSRKVET